MADLSFIEDSVAFPEKEEDEEEEEEGVEWGYEEGNRPRVGRAVRGPGPRECVSPSAEFLQLLRAPSSAAASPLSHVRLCRFPAPQAGFGAEVAPGRAGAPAACVRVGEPGRAAGQQLAPAAVRRARLKLRL